MKNCANKLFLSFLLAALAFCFLLSSCSSENKKARLLDAWQDFAKTQSPLQAELANLTSALEGFKDSDEYVLEIDGTKSPSAQCVDLALESARAALEAFQAGDQDLYKKQCAELAVRMNDFLICSLKSESDFVMPFVELLTIISFLAVFIVFGGVAYMKKKDENDRLELESRTIAQVQENERERISRDLHDTVIQDTRTALLHVRELEGASDQNAARALAAKIAALEERNLKNMRSIIRNLTPPEIETADFAILLGEYARNVQEFNGIECKFHSEADAGLAALSAEQKLHIFRIIQESVNNAIKHAAASEISVFARQGDSSGQLVFIVSDDGKGMDGGADEAAPTGTHLGLRGMKSRAAMLGGELLIKSSSDCGTQVKLVVPASFAPRPK